MSLKLYHQHRVQLTRHVREHPKQQVLLTLLCSVWIIYHVPTLQSHRSDCCSIAKSRSVSAKYIRKKEGENIIIIIILLLFSPL